MAPELSLVENRASTQHPDQPAIQHPAVHPAVHVGSTQCMSCAEHGTSVLARSTVRLSMGERSGTVDLCDEHLTALREAVEPVLAASSQRARRRPADTAVPRLREGENREAIRRWAIRAGLPVSAVGTISSLVLEKYRTARDDTVTLP